MANDPTKNKSHSRPHRHHYDAEMLDVEVARERILSFFEVLPGTNESPVDALGQVLAENITATFDIPSLANSAMDGYAVRSCDIQSVTTNKPTTLRVIGMVSAGELPSETVAEGSAVRIMTGAPMPEGADCVVPFEDTDESERNEIWNDSSEIRVNLRMVPGDNIRAAGEDVRAGSIVMAAGTELRPSEVGLVASLGHATVKVHRRPRISIVGTGNELIEPGEQHQPGLVFDSNSYSVAACVQRCGGIPVLSGISRDSIADLNDTLDHALEGVDMVITSAGVSKGDYDVVKDVLSQRGEIALWSVRMRPAKPLAFGVLNGRDGQGIPHLGLPGNPVSAMVAFEQFARPAIRKMMGKAQAERPTVMAVLDDPIENHDGRRVYARVFVYLDTEGIYRARSTGSQSSNVLTSMANANGLAICPHDRDRLGVGDIAKVQMLDWPENVF